MSSRTLKESQGQKVCQISHEVARVPITAATQCHLSSRLGGASRSDCAHSMTPYDIPNGQQHEGSKPRPAAVGERSGVNDPHENASGRSRRNAMESMSMNGNNSHITTLWRASTNDHLLSAPAVW